MYHIYKNLFYELRTFRTETLPFLKMRLPKSIEMFVILQYFLQPEILTNIA